MAHLTCLIRFFFVSWMEALQCLDRQSMYWSMIRSGPEIHGADGGTGITS